MTRQVLCIALNGAAGRMGCELARVARTREDIRISAAVEREGSPSLGRDLGVLAGFAPLGVEIGSSLKNACSSSDVIVDFSLAEAVPAVAETACLHKKPLVCGTTGIDEAGRAALKRAAREIPVIHAANFSRGIAAVTALVELAAKALSSDYDIEIIETHHRHKVDAPSGTALALAEAARRKRGLNLPQQLRFGRSGRLGERPSGEIGIHSVRAGGVFGEHAVLFTNQHEQVTISHHAFSRAVFAEGALSAALFIADRPPGEYAMSDIVFGS